MKIESMTYLCMSGTQTSLTMETPIWKDRQLPQMNTSNKGRPIIFIRARTYPWTLHHWIWQRWTI